MSSVKRVLVLGSTGSIGEQALAVIEASDELELVGLSAGHRWQRLVEQARKYGVGRIALSSRDAAASAREAVGSTVEVLSGEEGVRELAATSGADLVLNAIVGSAGLGPSIVVLSEGIDLALANKESLVVGGDLVTTLAEVSGARILPVDSEHSAIFQLIEGERQAPGYRAGTVERIQLTASGGPFRELKDLTGVTPEQALAHPTWEMGGRISIDSATLMNKGLEMIEAHHLFGTPYDQIDVVIHPQSIVHSLIHLSDGASLAHLGYPDMKVPISYALHYPGRAPVDLPRLDLAMVGALTFEVPDEQRFPCLRLAREAGRAGGCAPCVMNAADEVAVAEFLDGNIPFTGIAEVVETALERVGAQPVSHFDDLYAADADARRIAYEAVAAGVGSAN